MSQTPAHPVPRLLLFPQVGRPEAKDGRPAVRRYSLTFLPGVPGPGGARPGAAKRPPA